MLVGAGCVVDHLQTDVAPPREEVLARIEGAAGVVTMMSDRVDDPFLSAAGDTLRVVANFAVGYDNIDLAACSRRSVRATNTPGVLTEATADIAWALIMATARRVIEGDRKVREGRWQGWYPTELLGVELHGATLGIVGAGRIGTATARRALGFGMHILYTHPRANPELEQEQRAQRVPLDELIEAADIVSLHVPYRPENRHLIDAARLARMKPGALLINTARGPIIDERALLAALQSDRLRAGLDVYEHEPQLTPGLTELPNVVLLPHLGSGTVATRQRMSEMVANNILAVLRDEPPPHPIS